MSADPREDRAPLRPRGVLTQGVDRHQLANGGKPDVGSGVTPCIGLDQGMAANHRLEVHTAQADSGGAVMDVRPTTRIVDMIGGESRDLLQVMGMGGASMSMSDFKYGQNVFVPDGTYLAMVLVGMDTAEFRDVMITASPMMADHAMAPDTSTGHETAMPHEVPMAAGAAHEGHMFTQESDLTHARPVQARVG